MPANLKNSSVATGLEKASVRSNPKERQCQRMLNYRTIAFVSHASKVMFKILQARLQQYVNHELPDVQAGFRKGIGSRDQIANIRWIIKKARDFQKHISVQFSHSVMSDSLQPLGLQHTRHPSPSLTPRVYSDLCLLSR